MQNRITAILSDYDGTLCPTNSILNQNGTIPEELEQVLWDISQQIPVCIISSKDYHFLHPRTRFARILSCIMGIETITLKAHNKEKEEKIERVAEIGRHFSSHDAEHGYNNGQDCIEESHLLVKDTNALQINSHLLSRLAEEIDLRFKDSVTVERKFTADRKFLAGITIDYRHIKDWGIYKKSLEPSLIEMINEYQSSSSPDAAKLHIQTYSSHPFLDLYAVYCDKGMAFDYVSSKIANPKDTVEQSIMYIGDSENDNAAFKRADVSIGVISDDRLRPKLFCTNILKFDVLSIFLKRLIDNNFVFPPPEL